MWIEAVDRPEVPPVEMPARFKHDIAYFMTPSEERGAPRLSPGEYWIDLAEAQTWLESGVLLVVSPLDSENKAEIEISEEQEAWLEWLLKHQVQKVRVK